MGLSPKQSLLANQYESGVPTHTLWDEYAEQHNPIASANHRFTPDTPDAHGGQAYTNSIEQYGFADQTRLIVWAYNQNYQGIAPLDLQPQLQLPNPWEIE